MNELTTQQTQVVTSAGDNMFFNVALFEHAQRVAKMLGASTMVPEHFRGPNNIGNVLIAMNYAQRVRADVFMVMQSLYVVHGRPGLEGKLIIALVNQCGRFEPLQFDMDDDGCLAFAKEIKSAKILKGPKVTWTMVKAEGWLGKNGSKWQTMPDVMFRYRSAAFFARTYCPEVLLGMQTKEELEDIITLQPASNGKSWEPEPTPPNPDFNYDAFRKGLVGDGFAEADIDAFEAKLSAHYKKPVEEIRQQIGDNPDAFFASLSKWTQTNGTPQPPVQAEEPEENTNETVDPGTEDPIRDEFISLKTQGFATWVFKNKARIPTFTSEIQAEILQKWRKMYPNATFPLDKKTEEEAPKTNGSRPTIFCPVNQTRKYVSVCEECIQAEKCQTYQEYLFENSEQSVEAPPTN